MENGGQLKNPKISPKSIINQKFGSKAVYVIEEVQQGNPQNELLSLAIPQKGPSLYRCRLELPEVTVVSETFKRKKEAEQSAADMALQKLGIHPDNSTQTVLDAESELVSRLTYLFSSEFLLSPHPLSGHLRAILRREDSLCDSVPVSVLIACDPKLTSLCKLIDNSVEFNPFLALNIIVRAASKLQEVVCIGDNQLCLRRNERYPPECMQQVLDQCSDVTEQKLVEAIYIPCSYDLAVRPLSLNVDSKGYYLDAIAEELSVADASNVLLSRTVGKASSEIRVYVSALEKSNLVVALENRRVSEEFRTDEYLNARASYLSSQEVYGDAILASVGYRWNSSDLFIEDISQHTYFRLLLGKTPNGLYKLSRESILAADLPAMFTMRSHWRGSLPKEILCTFCRQHRLSEPIFATTCNSSGYGEDSTGLCKKLKDAGEGAGFRSGDIISGNGKKSDESEISYKCAVKLYSKQQELILECTPKESYKKQNEAIQNAALRVLSFLNMYFKQMDMPVVQLTSAAASLDMHCHLTYFVKEFSLCQLIHNVRLQCSSRGNLLSAHHTNGSNYTTEVSSHSLNIVGSDSGMTPANGSLVSIKYSVSLVVEGGYMKEMLESSDDFEFEMGYGAVPACIETAIMQMTAGQSVCFSKELPPHDLILATTSDSDKVLSMLSTSSCCLEYHVTLLRVTVPLEDRMEQALFSPPLSKQRVIYALQHIKESFATSLIDFGCGSGSLLDALLDCPSTLENIVGVDISQKGLIRAAKILHSKLSKLKATSSQFGLKSAVLYEGSITVFDSRSYGFDIGTCLEVIEHMEEDEASVFGDTVLGYFRPKLLIISTPNYEYNVILHKSSVPNQEDQDDKAESTSCRFRNHDHKFEWTRQQFNDWATGLASKHSYKVEFSGVGGSGDEPGFASQIAVFRREPQEEEEIEDRGNDDFHDYKVLWEWSGADA